MENETHVEYSADNSGLARRQLWRLGGVLSAKAAPGDQGRIPPIINSKNLEFRELGPADDGRGALMIFAVVGEQPNIVFTWAQPSGGVWETTKQRHHPGETDILIRRVSRPSATSPTRAVRTPCRVWVGNGQPNKPAELVMGRTGA